MMLMWFYCGYENASSSSFARPSPSPLFVHSTLSRVASRRVAHSARVPGRSAAATAAAFGTPVARVSADSNAPRGTIKGIAMPAAPMKHDHITTGSRCMAR